MFLFDGIPSGVREVVQHKLPLWTDVTNLLWMLHTTSRQKYENLRAASTVLRVSKPLQSRQDFRIAASSVESKLIWKPLAYVRCTFGGLRENSHLWIPLSGATCWAQTSANLGWWYLQAVVTRSHHNRLVWSWLLNGHYLGTTGGTAPRQAAPTQRWHLHCSLRCGGMATPPSWPETKWSCHTEAAQTHHGDSKSKQLHVTPEGGLPLSHRYQMLSAHTRLKMSFFVVLVHTNNKNIELGLRVTK